MSLIISAENHTDVVCREGNTISSLSNASLQRKRCRLCKPQEEVKPIKSSESGKLEVRNALRITTSHTFSLYSGHRSHSTLVEHLPQPVGDVQPMYCVWCSTNVLCDLRLSESLNCIQLIDAELQCSKFRFKMNINYAFIVPAVPVT